MHAVADYLSNPVEKLASIWQRLLRSPLYLRLAKGMAWTLLGTALARALGLLSSMLAARLLSRVAFGEFAVIQSTVTMFGTFAGLGLGITATKYVAEWRDTQPERCGAVTSLTLWVGLAGGLLGTVLCWLGADWLAVQTLAAPALAPVLRASSVLVLLMTVQNVYTGALAGFESFRSVALLNLLGGIFGAPMVAFGAWKFGLSGAIWGTILQNLIACISGDFLLKRENDRRGIQLWHQHPQSNWSRWNNERRILWRFSVPAFLSSMLVGPVNWFCNMLLVNQPAGYGQVALLSAANQWKNFVGFVPLALVSVLVPMLANLHAAGRVQDFLRLLKRQILISSGLCLAFALPLILFSGSVMRCYGQDFVEGSPVLVLTLCSTAIATVNNLLSRSMQSAGRAWLDFGFSGVWAVALICSSILLIPGHGAMGVAIAQAIAAIVLGLWQWKVLDRVIEPIGKSPAVGACNGD